MVIEVTFDVTDVYISTTVSPVYVNVSFEAPSGGGGAVWGDITGTLSDQTDLQTALDGKFDDPTGTSLQYIDGTGALQTFPLTLPVLQQVRNQTGGTLAVGTVVYISGATGNLPTVTKAIATGDATSAQTLGMVSAAIANNGTGYVVVIGTCSGLDTSAYTEGQQLYLSYTTAGAVTTTKPYAPYHLVYIGIVTRAHPTLGTVEVRVQNGYELDEIHDVDALNPNNNDGIFYNSTTSLWEHKQISTALGYTPANAATTLTINGVTYDLSANRTWTISAGISGSGASGQVSYWDGTTSQTGSANFLWDNTNRRLSIITNGAALRGIAVSEYSNSVAAAIATFEKSRGTFSSPINVNASDLIGGFSFSARVGGVFTSDRALFGANMATSTGIGLYFNAGSSDGVYAPSMYIHPTGNVAINPGGSIISGSITDNGQRLQVQGTTLLNGNVTFSSSTGMFWDATNSRLGIGTNVPLTPLHINADMPTINGLTVTRTGVALADANFQITNLTSLAGQFCPSYFFTSNYLVSSATIGGFIGARITNNSPSDIGLILEARTKSGSALSSGYILSFRSLTTDYVRIAHNGNMLLQNGGTFTDSGERLQVTGNTILNGSVKIGGSNLANADIILQVNGTNKYVNYNTSFLNGSFYTYQAFGAWDAYGSDSAAGTILAIGGYRASQWAGITFHSSGSERMRIKSNGQVRFVPLASAPSSPQAGDVYFDSTLNKLRVYTTAWETITSV